MTGDSVVQLRFTGMSLQNDAGEEMFTGPTELTPNLPALRKAVQFDASEGDDRLVHRLRQGGLRHARP